MIAAIAANPCEMTVAQALPATPILNTTMKSKSRKTFITVDATNITNGEKESPNALNIDTIRL